MPEDLCNTRKGYISVKGHQSGSALEQQQLWFMAHSTDKDPGALQGRLVSELL